MANLPNGALPAPLRPEIYAHIVGWGMAVPEGIMTNADIAAIIDTTDEWIVSRTGIHERRIANERETTGTLALKAAQNALDVADMLPEDLDLIIVATSTPENIFPSVASLVQSWLGANKAGAFDLSAACSGFVYAVNTAAQSIRSGSIQTAIVIGSETMSRVLDWQDRTTCILFGDGAGAVVLRASAVEGGILASVLRSDGAGADLLAIPTVGSIDTQLMPALGGEHKAYKMYMNGSEVFKFATRVITESIPQALHLAGLGMHDLRWVVPHQANTRILQAAARALKLDEGIFVTNIEHYGNTSAASIPMALCEAVQDGRIQENDIIALIGFGGGLSWATTIVKWGVPHADPNNLARFNYQRRRISYFLAYWRARLNRISRQISATINRIRPRRGRMQRLKRKAERQNFD